jgi:predicted outer membrane repeat protein
MRVDSGKGGKGEAFWRRADISTHRGIYQREGEAMRLLTTLWCAALVLGLCGSISATVIHVPDDYPTIQWGIDAAVGGDTVLVADGTYTGSLNRDLDFGGKAIVVMSENGPHVTIIDCEGSISEPHRGFYFHSGEGPASVVRGFIIQGGWAEYGGGINCDSSSPTIQGNTIRGNTAGYDGGGIYCGECSSVIVDNTITENAANTGGGIACYYNSSPTVMNTILWADDAGTGHEIYLGEASSMAVSYSDISSRWLAVFVAPGCTLEWGEGNIETNPKFVLANLQDYRLLWGSPCIDVGHPDYLDPDGTRSDIGAHFFDQSKTIVAYATPQTRTLSPGDNCAVLYAMINIHPEPVEVRGGVELTLPNGEPWPGNPLEGPGYTVFPPEFTWQIVREYTVPETWPLGVSVFTWRVGMPGNLYDRDRFLFTVVEP